MESKFVDEKMKTMSTLLQDCLRFPLSVGRVSGKITSNSQVLNQPGSICDKFQPFASFFATVTISQQRMGTK